MTCLPASRSPMVTSP